MVTAAILVALPTNALACTGIYVGSDLTADGSTFYGRSEDYGTRYRKVWGVEAATQDSTNVYENAAEKDDPSDDHFSRPYPSKTYRFTYVRDSANYWAGYQLAYAEAGVNEKGVGTTATVTTDYNDDAAAADPLLETGLTEFNLGSIILGESESARQGVANIGAVIDEYGSGECYQFFIGDGTETWLFAAVSGHQWVAFKLPADQVSVNPNYSSLKAHIDLDSADVLHSADLKSLPEEKGFLKTFDDGSMDVFGTYGVTDEGTGQYTRYWMGTRYFNEAYSDSLVIGADDAANHQVTSIENADLLISSRSGLTTSEVLSSLATRGTGTLFDADLYPYQRSKDSSGHTLVQGVYPVGNSRQAECHFFQVRPNMDDDITTLQWQCLSRAEFSIFLPSYSSLVTTVDSDYSDGPVDHDDQEATDVDESGAAVYVFDDIADLCDANRDACAAGVTAYFSAIQNQVIEQQGTVDQVISTIPSDQRTVFANQMSLEVSKQVHAKASACLDELRSYVAAGDFSTPFASSDLDADGTLVSPVTYAQAAQDFDATKAADEQATEADATATAEQNVADACAEASDEASTEGSAASEGLSTGSIAFLVFLGAVVVIGIALGVSRNRHEG
ncbi:MAG: C69 family dipeptidase [Atopobiaceae bacterium]|jgi:dipeptidase|nr:C69 family dipeptidase [Atopobiaceae bacterium]MCI2208077.1 C69 family dipeptidase [Atopobiaceae bacterium]